MNTKQLLNNKGIINHVRGRDNLFCLFVNLTYMKTNIFFAVIIFSLVFSKFSFAQGCMEADSEEGVNVIGYIQPSYDNYFFDEDALGNTENKPNSFYFKRARIGVTGSIPYDISYYVMAELGPLANKGSAFLLDAFVTYAPFKKYLKFSMGQFKSPVGLELNTPCHALHTIRRSTAVNHLASPFRDLGIMLLGSTDSLFGKKDLISYRLAILNGTGLNFLGDTTNLNTWDNNKYKDIAARLVISPWEWLRIGGSFRTGIQGTIEIEGQVKNKRTRYGADVEFEYKNFLLQGEYIVGEDIVAVGSDDPSGGGGCGGKSTSADDDQSESKTYNRDGFFVQAMYMTPWNLQPVVKFETYNPDGLNYYYLFHPQKFGQNTWTWGINYFLNDWTRLQINYLYNAEETGNDEFPNDAIMFQIQAKF